MIRLASVNIIFDQSLVIGSRINHLDYIRSSRTVELAFQKLNF